MANSANGGAGLKQMALACITRVALLQPFGRRAAILPAKRKKGNRYELLNS